MSIKDKTQLPCSICGSLVLIDRDGVHPCKICLEKVRNAADNNGQVCGRREFINDLCGRGMGM